MLKLLDALQVFVSVIYGIARTLFSEGLGYFFLLNCEIYASIVLIVKNILCKCIVMFYRFTRIADLFG